MTELKRNKAYARLLRDITALHDRARQALLTAYWEIGRRIAEEEQRAQGKAAYGTQLIKYLSQDLQAELGSGFSVRNLQNMRRFYLDHPNTQPAAYLTWSHHVELMPISDSVVRQRLERQAIDEKLSRRQVRRIVQRALKDVSAQANGAGQANTNPDPVVLPCQRSPLQVFARVDRDHVPCARGKVVIDCGFNLWQTIPRAQAPTAQAPSYTYPAQVESVIDGDTLWALIDCTRGIYTRQKLRLHNIDTPELGTPAGEKARRFVKRTLKANPHIVVQTHKYDKYTRYLADVFYLPGKTNPQQVIKTGIHLNQQLLDKGLAQVWKGT